MKKQTHARLLFPFAVLLLTGVVMEMAAAPCGQTRPQKRRIHTVNLCDIISSPYRYDGKIVRIRAIHNNSMEGMGLYRADCSTEDKAITALLDCKNDVACREMRDKLHRAAEGNPFDGESVDVVVVGRVEALAPKGVNSKFNTSSAIFHIKQIEKIMPVSKPRS